MQHDLQDALDDRSRARDGYRGQWHPILAAEETEPGVWLMVSQQGTRYGVVRMLRVGGELGYRAVARGQQSADRELIGYFRMPRAATKAAHDR